MQAEAGLARARLAVLVAGHDLLEARQALEKSGSSDTRADVLADAQDALNSANLIIVETTRSIFPSADGIPQVGLDTRPAGRDSELDQTLNVSLAVFRTQLLESRRGLAVPSPTGAEAVPGVPVFGDDKGLQGEEGASPEMDKPGVTAGAGRDDGFREVKPDGSKTPHPGESTSEPGEVEMASAPIPDGIPDPQGDDIVARQLREAAMAEQDPALREKLWEEYKKYRAGL